MQEGFPRKGVDHVRLLIADHHRCVAEGLAALLAPLIRDIAVVYTGRDMLHRATTGRYDIVVSEIGMPDMPGLAPLHALSERRSVARFVVLSSHDEALVVQEAMQAGAWGYVLKQSSSGELIEAIGEVMAGRRYLSPGLMAALINAPVSVQKLTRRQREVLDRMAEGRRASDIAAELGISVRTVESHRQSLLDLLHVHSGVALVREAIRLGLVRDPSTPFTASSGKKLSP